MNRKFGCPAPHGFDCLRPEEIRPDAPSAFKNVRQDQHGHVAPDAIALLGNSLQLADHGPLQIRVAVIELERVRPAVEVRVAAIREYQRTGSCLDSTVVLRRPCQVTLAALDEVVRVFVDPRMIRCHMVRDEIQQQLQSALLQPPSQTCERLGAAEVAMDSVGLDGEPGAGDIFVLEIRQRRGELATPPGIGARDRLRRQAQSATRSGTRSSQILTPRDDPIPCPEHRPVSRACPGLEITRSTRRGY